MEISSKTAPARLQPWPVALRAPLADVTGAPGAPAGSLDSGALAVGADGSVVRYVPGRGWKREFLLSAGGSVVKASLRGVAWPEPRSAYAVGDLGAMWLWNAADELWVQDPGIPIGFEGNLMDVAFAPGDPDRGYAVGKSGVLLRYGKSWDQEALPAGFASANLTSIAFAGGQAIVAAGRRPAGQRRRRLARRRLRARAARQRAHRQPAALRGRRPARRRRRRRRPRHRHRARRRRRAVALLRPAAAGVDRDRRRGAARRRLGARGRLGRPAAGLPAGGRPARAGPDRAAADPAALRPAGDGYLLRETATGWEDEQRTAFAASSDDSPLKSDPVLSLLLDSSGSGWAVGGWSGDADSAGRGSSARNGAGRGIRERVRTAAVFRYGAGAGAAPGAAGSRPVPMPAGPIRLAVAGHAECDSACADLRPQGLGPDRSLAAALRT